MRNANLVANELHEMGFRTKVFASNAVQVTLTNRKVSTMEVIDALEQAFDVIQFRTVSTVDGVLVSW